MENGTPDVTSRPDAMKYDRPPPDPRAPRVTYRDPRLGTPAPSGIAIAFAALIAYYLGGPVASFAALGVSLAIAVLWFVWRHRRHDQ